MEGAKCRTASYGYDSSWSTPSRASSGSITTVGSLVCAPRKQCWVTLTVKGIALNLNFQASTCRYPVGN
eukprot:14217840-Alexandrium_andersonii.AAC.1